MDAPNQDVTRIHSLYQNNLDVESTRLIEGRDSFIGALRLVGSSGTV